MSMVMPAVENRVWTSPPCNGTAPNVNGSASPNGSSGDATLSETDKQLAIAIHLTPIAAIFFPLLFFAPLVIWLVRKDKSPFIDDHGREAVNMLITSILLTVVGVVFAISTLGIGTILIIPALVIWTIAIIIAEIRAALAVSRGEYFRYPMTIRLLT